MSLKWKSFVELTWTHSSQLESSKKGFHIYPVFGKSTSIELCSFQAQDCLFRVSYRQKLDTAWLLNSLPDGLNIEQSFHHLVHRLILHLGHVVVFHFLVALEKETLWNRIEITQANLHLSWVNLSYSLHWLELKMTWFMSWLSNSLPDEVEYRVILPPSWACCSRPFSCCSRKGETLWNRSVSSR